MDTDDFPEDRGASSPRRLRQLFYALGAILAAGFFTAIVMAGLGVGSPGWVELPAAFTSMAVAITAIGIALVVTYAFLPGILADERSFARERANEAALEAWERAREAVDQAEDRANAVVESTADAVRQEMRSGDDLVRSESETAVRRVDKAIVATMQDVTATQTAIANEAKARVADAKKAAEAAERLDRRIESARRAQKEASEDLAKRLATAKRTQTAATTKLRKRIDAFDDYVDQHESHHSILEAALAFDTEEIATLGARVNKPPGHGEPLAEIEGIEARYIEALQKAGIKDSEQLRTANAHDLARKLRVFPGQVHAWQAMCELMRIPGIGPQYAELLEQNGIHGMLDLAKADPAALEKTLEEAQAAHGETPAVGHRVANWVKTAKQYVEA